MLVFFSYLSKYQRYPKVIIAVDPNEIGESLLNGFTSIEVIQYPFSWAAKVACVYKWKGQGLTPNVRFVVLNFLPIPILPVTMVGKAKPPSYSRIKLFLLIKVLPQRTEVPGKGKSILQLRPQDLKKFDEAFAINSIPRFILIDAEWNLLNSKFVRPSSNVFDELLNINFK